MAAAKGTIPTECTLKIKEIVNLCGIVGVYHRKGGVTDPANLIKMTRKLIHRGPDEEGYFLNATELNSNKLDAPVRLIGRRSGPGGYVGLGHRRLSIIDLSSGQQPLSNEDGTIWITFNGEIYNYQDLMTQLKERGHRFKTNSDTETILHAYEEWGEKSVQYLRGMFAFGIWDENKQQLFLARDRLGKKPLYFYKTGEQLIFASEIKDENSFAVDIYDNDPQNFKSKKSIGTFQLSLEKDTSEDDDGLAFAAKDAYFFDLQKTLETSPGLYYYLIFQKGQSNPLFTGKFEVK